MPASRTGSRWATGVSVPVLPTTEAYAGPFSEALNASFGANTGNALNNYIIGNELNNILTGGAGNDTMNGGGDNDTFVYSAGFGADTSSSAFTVCASFAPMATRATYTCP